MSDYEAYFNSLSEGEIALSEREYLDALSSGYRPVSCTGARLLGLTYRALPSCRAKLSPVAASALCRLVDALDPFPIEAVISAIRHLLPAKYLPQAVDIQGGILSAIGGVRNVRSSANGYFYLETSCAGEDAIIYIYTYPDRVRVSCVLNIREDDTDSALSQETSVIEVGRDGSQYVADPVSIDPDDERADELTVLRVELLKVRTSGGETELIGMDEDYPFNNYGVFAVVQNSVYVPLYSTTVYKDIRSVFARACFLLEKRPLSISVDTMRNILTHEEGETYNDKLSVVDITGEYVTRNGSIVRVDVVDGGGVMPVRGVVVRGGVVSPGMVGAWNRAGYCISPYTPHPLDLIRRVSGGAE